VNEKTKSVVIHNAGQFAGNVDSPGGVVNIGKMDQDVTVVAKQLAEQFSDEPSVRAIIADESEDPTAKTGRLAQRLRELAGVGLQVAVVAAQQLMRAHGILPPVG
jgi:hypothetical protein